MTQYEYEVMERLEALEQRVEQKMRQCAYTPAGNNRVRQLKKLLWKIQDRLSCPSEIAAHTY